MSFTPDILAYARALSFDRASILPIGPPRYARQFSAWLASGYYGEMAYLASQAAKRLAPRQFAPGAASVLVLLANYDSGHLSDSSVDATRGRIARYARWPDYHQVIKPKLYALDAFIRMRTGRQALGKAFVDSSPVLERDFAEQAGLGFIGRNTCLITPGLGSWTVLAGLFVPEDLTPDPSPARRGEEIRCGRCTRCLDACPTQAFVAPYILDARRCISYLTIELRGPIPRELRPLMGNWVFGCDVCQEVCPYNRGMRTGATGPKALAGLVGDARNRLKPRVAGYEPPLAKHVFQDPVLTTSLSLTDLLALDDATFRTRFRGTPVLRAKRGGLVRNACVAAGNSGDAALVPALAALLADPEPLVRGHAAWALGRIGGSQAESALANALPQETNSWVREEIAAAIP